MGAMSLNNSKYSTTASETNEGWTAKGKTAASRGITSTSGNTSRPATTASQTGGPSSIGSASDSTSTKLGAPSVVGRDTSRFAKVPAVSLQSTQAYITEHATNTA